MAVLGRESYDAKLTRFQPCCPYLLIFSFFFCCCCFNYLQGDLNVQYVVQTRGLIIFLKPHFSVWKINFKSRENLRKTAGKEYNSPANKWLWVFALFVLRNCEKQFHSVAQAGLELTMHSWLTLNLWPLCLSAGIIWIRHYAKLTNG